MILGPLLAADVAAVSPIAAQANIRVLAFSNDASVATDGTFLLGFRPEEQVRRVVAYALDSGALVRAEPAPLRARLRTPSSKGCRTQISRPPPRRCRPRLRSMRDRRASPALAPDDAYGATVIEALRQRGGRRRRRTRRDPVLSTQYGGSVAGGAAGRGV